MKWIVAALVIWAVWWLFSKRKTVRKPSLIADARAVLGVAAGADATQIKAAHRRLMAEQHPDRGGSADRARQVNAARDTLLAGLRRDA